MINQNFLKYFGGIIGMIANVKQSRLNKVSKDLMDMYFGDLKVIKGNDNFNLIFLNSDGKVVVGVIGNYSNQQINKYVLGKINKLPSYIYSNAYVYPEIFYAIQRLMPFLSEDDIKSIFEKYFKKRYGVKVELLVDSGYGVIYLKLEQDFLKKK